MSWLPDDAPKAVRIALWILYGWMGLAALAILVGILQLFGSSAGAEVVTGPIIAFVAWATMTHWIGRGSTVARIIFGGVTAVTALSVVPTVPALFAQGAGIRSWLAAQLILGVVGSQVAVVVLLLTRESRLWFAAHRSARRRTRSPAPGAVADDLQPFGQRRGMEPGSVSCARCAGHLAKVDLGAGAQVVIGTAPILYLGVVCGHCGKIECGPCRSALAADAPCTWCGGPVRPAYEHYLR